MNKFRMFFFGRLMIVPVLFFSVFTVLALPQTTYAATLYGRNEYQGYFSGAYSSGQAWRDCGSGRAGQLICGGIGADNLSQFISFYNTRLNNTSTADNRSAAFTILAMLGVTGPNAGGSGDAGVAKARALFESWKKLVTAYDAAGRVNYNHTSFAFRTNTGYRSGDVLWHYERNSSGTIITVYETAITFKLNDGTYVAIKKSCANMVGGYSALDKLPYWNITTATTMSVNGGSYSSSDSDVHFGDKVSWNHSIKNIGPNPINRTVYYDYQNGGDLGSGNSSNTGVTNLAVDASTSFPSSINIDPDKYLIGNRLCRLTRVSQYFEGYITGINTPKLSNDVCVTVRAVPSDYELHPLVELNPEGVIEAGSTVDVSPSITKSGSTASDTVIYFLTKTTTNPLTSVKTVKTYPEASGKFTANTKTTVSSYIESDTEYIPGTTICYYLTVTPSSSTSATSTAKSPEVCVTIAKKPKVQVWGGDVKVGRNFNIIGSSFQESNIQTSTSIKTLTGDTAPKTFGSWAEYALVTKGLIKGTGSGTALNGGLLNAKLCAYNKLTFSNSITGSPCKLETNIGKYDFKATTIPDISSRFRFFSTTPRLGISSPNFNLTNVASGTYTLDRNVSISASNLDAGRQIIINAPGYNVTISGNITYQNAIASLSKIPQLIIIAKNIYIQSGVTGVDAWLIAKASSSSTNGIINTCTINDDLTKTPPTQKTPSNPDTCKGSLTINGPVMANKLLLKRTGGSGAQGQSGDPAEVFNLRADAYLWAYSQAGGSNRMWTVYSTNVPPRL